MNQKGFAITSVIYGLSVLGIMIVMILMGTLSSTRQNVSEEAKMVEEFLIAFNQTQVTYRGHGAYTYVVPGGETGWYRIEAFGPRGCGDGGHGAYTTGIIFLNEGDKLNVNIGSCDGDTTVKLASEGTNAMVAAGGRAQRPGGTVKCFDTEPPGGNINMDTFELIDNTKPFTGVEDVAITDSGCTNKSSIKGYPYNNGALANFGYYYFVDGLILPAANAGTDGKVIIERIAERDDIVETIPRKNTKFNNVNSITVETNPNRGISRICYTYHDDYNATRKGFAGHAACCNGTNTCTVADKNIDDITVIFAGNQMKKNLGGVTIKFNGTIVYASTAYLGTTAEGLGIHLSAYQPSSYDANLSDNDDDFPAHGNYYIFPVVAPNKSVSASETAAGEGNKLKIEYLTGESRQKWSIDLLNTPGNTYQIYEHIGNGSGKKEYRIMELARYKAMNIYHDENYKGNFISSPETFNSLSRNEPQIWNIYALGDGTYAIKTVVESFDITQKSGFLFAKPRGVSINNIDDIMIGVARSDTIGLAEYKTMPTNIERFFLYSLDFSN